MNISLLYLVFGILFLVWGVCDVLRLNIRFTFTRRMQGEEKQLWQRWFGVLELFMAAAGFCVCLVHEPHVISAALALLLLAAVCILGPYYRWQKEHRDGPDT